MRFDGFGRSLLFAAFAGLGTGFVLVIEPVLGAANALALYLISTVALYLFGLGTQPRRRLGAGGLTLLLGGVVWLLGPTPREAAIVAVALLSIGRSVICLPARGARAWAIELALSGGGLLMAGVVLGSSPHSAALAVWAFFLIQSVFFLIGGGSRSAAEPEVDPFEAARDRALAVMESSV